MAAVEEPMDQLVATARYSPYRIFTAEEWARFRDQTPLTLTEEEVHRLSSMYEPDRKSVV